jgi:anaerobic ribonucleoside-triphosphate reductase activating protein
MVLEAIDELEYQSGITFSGGDPMFQPEACNEIAKYCKNKGYNIWTYTGFTFEKIMEMAEEKPIYREFLSNIDV